MEADEDLQLSLQHAGVCSLWHMQPWARLEQSSQASPASQGSSLQGVGHPPSLALTSPLPTPTASCWRGEPSVTPY